MLRRTNPDEKIEVAIIDGLDWLFNDDNQQLLEGLDILPQLVAKTLDADPASISELCLRLMERLIERDEKQDSGKTHLVSRGEAISDSLVNYLINMMLDNLEWNDELYIPRDLIVLIRYQTGGEISDQAKKLAIRDRKFNAVWIALQLSEQGKTPSYREIARVLGVNPTTVMRWFPNNDLTEQIEMLKKGNQWLDSLHKPK